MLSASVTAMATSSLSLKNASGSEISDINDIPDPQKTLKLSDLGIGECGWMVHDPVETETENILKITIISWDQYCKDNPTDACLYNDERHNKVAHRLEGRKNGKEYAQSWCEDRGWDCVLYPTFQDAHNVYLKSILKHQNRLKKALENFQSCWL